MYQEVGAYSSGFSMARVPACIAVVWLGLHIAQLSCGVCHIRLCVDCCRDRVRHFACLLTLRDLELLSEYCKTLVSGCRRM